MRWREGPDGGSDQIGDLRSTNRWWAISDRAIFRYAEGKGKKGRPCPGSGKAKVTHQHDGLIAKKAAVTTDHERGCVCQQRLRHPSQSPAEGCPAVLPRSTTAAIRAKLPSALGVLRAARAALFTMQQAAMPGGPHPFPSPSFAAARPAELDERDNIGRIGCPYHYICLHVCPAGPPMPAIQPVRPHGHP